jgi:AAA15 family ATPase/GTPase
MRFAPELKKKKFLQFAFQGTRENQLFLTNAVHQKVETFKPIYDWFRDKLVLIAPDSRFGPIQQFIEKDHPLSHQMSETLSQLDTGISRLGGDQIEIDSLPVPENVKNELMEKLKEGDTADIGIEPDNERFLIAKQDGQLKARKLVSYHSDIGGKEIRFEITHESDGTRRAIDLLPAFLDLIGGTDKVYAIDELDRSLHTLLSQSLLNGYLDSVDQEARSQLLFTTHDVLLMDQKIFRRDEMWVTERDPMGCASLIAFSDYKDIRADKDIRKSYLQGRIGGIPRILLKDLSNQRSTDKAEGDAI